MNESQIVTPEEAQEGLDDWAEELKGTFKGRLLHTIATEPDRTRAAVVKALRDAERRMFGTTDGDLIGGDPELPAGELRRLLWLPYNEDGESPIENGADW